MKISVEELLAPLPGNSPCGEDLSYDPALGELETRIQGKAETQFTAAEEPNWRDVQKLCLELFTRTKDLRVTVALALALLRLDGLPGFAQGMEVLRGLLERYWPTFFPRLDPDDNNDPLERMNLLSSLTAPEGTFGDALRFIARLRQVPLCQSPVAGAFSLAQIAAATNPPSGGGDASAAAGPDPAVVQAAFRDTPAEWLEEQFRAAESALAAVEGIGGFLAATVGVGNATNLEPLAVVLRDIRTRLAPHLPSASAAAAIGAPAANVAGGTPGAARPDVIGSRDDVIRAIDAICGFYAAQEPSSPVPALLMQARKLVGLPFLEILQLLTPEVTPQVRLTLPETNG